VPPAAVKLTEYGTPTIPERSVSGTWIQTGFGFTAGTNCVKCTVCAWSAPAARSTVESSATKLEPSCGPIWICAFVASRPGGSFAESNGTTTSTGLRNVCQSGPASKPLPSGVAPSALVAGAAFASSVMWVILASAPGGMTIFAPDG
jgi:hypothetical protein